MASVETDGGAMILHTCNCPYAELVSPHSELCYMDLKLIGDLTGLELERVAHIADGDKRCSYRMAPEETGNRSDSALVLDLPIRSTANV